MRVLLSGNEAIAYGAHAAGVAVATGYPGTPSTEILENLAKYKDVDASWAPNEKVALEVAIGSSIAGARSLVAMKHVGLNVAADPLFTVAYTGVNAGLVIVSADDPGMHSSQNEQDNRYYAKAAKVPMLEPSDSQEAASLVEDAFIISETFDIPVLLRTTTRVNHSKSLVEVDLEQTKREPGYKKNAEKYVMIPANARVRRRLLEDRLKALEEFSEGFSGNKIEWGSREVGFITSGISYQYVKELFPEASILKLAMTYPLPRMLITGYVNQIEKVIVVEELEPYLEEQIKSWGLSVSGKESIPSIGELNPDIIADALIPREEAIENSKQSALPGRPPMLCAGCPHRGVFYELRRLKMVVTGDIGCYTLGVLPPLGSMDTCICMGASIGNAMGVQKATGTKDIVAVIGDSTFVHSGITPLIDIVYNGGITTVIILDNRTTAMTGRQDHPGTGRTLKGIDSHMLDFEKLVKAIGINSVRTVDPYDLKAVRKAIKEETAKDEPSVIIFRRACLLVEKPKGQPYTVNEKCDGCKVCLRLGCPAISWVNGRAEIDISQCAGCEICAKLCKRDAITVIK
ncbi:MAG: indolepyruvate ferredoxin oxidoreductase subunit alpha [Firmicutes bacterium]|nr:indolepyruvate ferredoxin oxidoreductase subunit alpha [Bacillota bacterium]